MTSAFAGFIDGISLPKWRDWLFSAKTFAASMLALYIALAAGLPRPYWAMATVYIVANPLSGATRSKALFRICGTVVGASAAVFFLPPLVNTPILMSAVVAVWTGSLLFVSFLDRSPRSYLFMLSGYTLPLIALPAVDDPSRVFDIAVARALEIGLGIVCASLIHSLVLPGRVGPIVGARATSWLADARGWLGHVLALRGGPRESAPTTADRTRALTGEMTALDGLIAQLAYDPAMHLVVRHARALRARMALLLPLASSLADRLDAVRLAGGMPPELAAVAADLDALIGAGDVGGTVAATGDVRAEGGAGMDRAADALRDRMAALQAGANASGDWHGLLVASALQRMREIVDLWQDCATLRAQVLAGRRARQRVSLAMADVPATAPHFDWPMMVFSAVSAMGAAFSAALIWIYSGWTQGAAFVMIAAVACSFFATADAPVPMIRMFIRWTVVATIAAAVYVFAILPGVHTFPGLVVVFAVPFMGLGLLITRPRTMMIGMLVGVNLATLMSLQEVYSANFESFANGSLATVGGGVYALAWMSLTRPFGAALMARRLVRAGWREIAAAADGGAGTAPHLFAGRSLDRLGQLVPRLAGGSAIDTGPADILAEMRVGLNVIELARAHKAISRDLRPSLKAVLDAVGELFAARARTGRRCEPGEALKRRIDAGLTAALEDARRAIAAAGEPAVAAGVARRARDGAVRARSLASADRRSPGDGAQVETCRAALAALVGLRLALYPDAPPPAGLDAAPPADMPPAYAIAAE